MKFMKQVQYAIVGSGVAGLALAYSLAKKGAKGVLLLEQEKRLGVHSSGQNAGMIRQVVTHEAVGHLAQKGAAFLRSLPADWKVGYRPCGSLLLAKGKETESLHHAAHLAQKIGLSLEWNSAKEAIRKVPFLKGADFKEALFCPSDGVINIYALLSGYLRGAERGGVQIWMGARVKAIHADSHGIFQLNTAKGKVKARILINAAGAWAESVSKMADVSPIYFRSYRRHLLLSRPLRDVNPDWPFVWDMTHAIYFRPEEGGLLLSPCDQDLLPGGRCPADRMLAWKRLRERLIHFPALPKIFIRRSWGGLRTFSPDDNFCIGWETKQKNFFWLAGLDGHGMTTSSAVGEFASDLLLGKKGDPYFEKSFSPKRFQTGLIEEGD